VPAQPGPGDADPTEEPIMRPLSFALFAALGLAALAPSQARAQSWRPTYSYPGFYSSSSYTPTYSTRSYYLPYASAYGGSLYGGHSRSDYVVPTPSAYPMGNYGYDYAYTPSYTGYTYTPGYTNYYYTPGYTNYYYTPGYTNYSYRGYYYTPSYGSYSYSYSPGYYYYR
jgi:hypothetical protein